MRWLWGGKEVAEMAQCIKRFVCKHEDLSLFSGAQVDNVRYGGVLAVIQDCGSRARQSSEVYWQASLPDLASSGVWERLSPKDKKQSRKHPRNTRGWPLASTPYPSRCKCTPALNASTHREGGHCTLETWVDCSTEEYAEASCLEARIPTVILVPLGWVLQRNWYSHRYAPRRMLQQNCLALSTFWGNSCIFKVSFKITFS